MTAITLDRAIDEYLGELARRGRTPGTRQRYREMLNKLAAFEEDRLPEPIRRKLDELKARPASRRRRRQ